MKRDFHQFEDIIRKDDDNIGGIVIYHQHTPVYEQYFNGCDRNSCMHIYSVTKSIVSILLGIAIDQHRITSIKQSIMDFFPEYEQTSNLQQITLEDIITMRAPYRYELETAPYEAYFTSEDRTYFTLQQLDGQTKTRDFFYAGLIGPDLLTAILTRVCGQSVLSFAQRYLFEPLGIKVENALYFQNEEEQMAFQTRRDIRGWVSDSHGIQAGGWGLSLSAMDMAKIGELFVQEGRWNNQQIVSKAWIKESTREHSRWIEEDLPYGYLWWIMENKGFAAMGDGGNTIYVNPHKALVVAINSSFAQQAKDRMKLINECIEPLFDE